MRREITSWHSSRTNRDMPIVTYGHYGFALLLIPTAGADYLEYERFGLINTIAPFIDAGKVKVFSINSMNKESWMNYEMWGAHKAINHNNFNHYVFEEVIPFIRSNVGNDTLIFTCGASFGALHSMNLFLKRPDIINGVVAMSGVYDLTEYTRGYWDEQVYYNSPVHYVPNLHDNWYLDKIRASHHIHILSGSGDYEAPDENRRFSEILWSKGIWHDLEIWGPDIKHEWSTWHKMLPHVLSTKF